MFGVKNNRSDDDMVMREDLKVSNIKCFWEQDNSKMMTHNFIIQNSYNVPHKKNWSIMCINNMSMYVFLETSL